MTIRRLLECDAMRYDLSLIEFYIRWMYVEVPVPMNDGLLIYSANVLQCVCAREIRSLAIKQTLMPLRHRWPGRIAVRVVGSGEAVQPIAQASAESKASQIYRLCRECVMLESLQKPHASCLASCENAAQGSAVRRDAGFRAGR